MNLYKLELYCLYMSLIPSDAKKLTPGDRAPEFSLAGVDGKTYSLSDFKEFEGLLIIFMCNHCPYVKPKIAALVELHEKFGKRVAVVGINSNDLNYPDEGMENMKAFAKTRGMNFPYLLDDTQVVARAYGATCTPDPFLFDKNQKLVFHGRINNAMEPDDTATENTMEESIELMLSGKEIPKWFEPSLGCSIKWTDE